MAFTMPVPAQDLAVEYLETVANQTYLPERLYVVGHSKGGNLAEYAAASLARPPSRSVSSASTTSTAPDSRPAPSRPTITLR